jgi:hypothetical protein
MKKQRTASTLYKTLGFRWLREVPAAHQVWCKWKGINPQSPTISYRHPFNKIELNRHG